MSVRKLTVGLLAVAALLAGPRVVGAQEHLPIADPFHFDPDFRWFEPIYDADLAEMKPHRRANHGWYGTYDRLNLWVTRPEHEQSYTQGDFGWGNRYDLGYMLDCGTSGWGMSYINMGGPNSYETNRVERLNRVNELDLITEEPGDALFDPWGQTIPAADRNDPDFWERLYDVRQSLNVLRLQSFELNKTWRLEPFHYGGIIEPLVGFRHVTANDLYLRQNYTRSPFRLGFEAPVVEDVDTLPHVTETLTSLRSRANNRMFGGQAGFRYYKFQNRWTLSTDTKVFVMHNFQNHESLVISESTEYSTADAAIDRVPIMVVNTRTPKDYRHNDEFVYGFDVRGEAAYTLTRDVSVRVGFQVINFAQGIWRGPADVAQDQNVILAGATFGVTLNR